MTPQRCIMYTDYYGLREEPFNITPDLRYLYLTEQHCEGLNHMLYGIRQRKGFICLTGEIGAGKTTLCRALLEELGDGYHTALVLNPMLTENQLVRAILTEFGVKTKRLDRLGYLEALNDFLLKVNSSGRDAVVIIDEAQDMPSRTLEMTRLLGNLETQRQKLLQIVLVGQPELRQTLARPSLRQLAQRITVRYHLGGMSRQQTQEYIRHRLTMAAGPGGGGPVLRFDSAAVNEIYRHSQGRPRLVNAIGDKALLAGFVHRTGRIDRRLVRIAVNELKEVA